MLAEILRKGGDRSDIDCEAAGVALLVPSCWPCDESLAQAARESFGVEQPPSRVAETCLVSVTRGVGSDLWLLVMIEDALASSLATVELVGSAQEAAELAWLLAARDLPVLRAFRPLEQRPCWRAVLIAKYGKGEAPRFLDGRSFGLALFLASASVLLERVLPADLLALGAVTAEGKVEPVGGLREKLAVVSEWAAGVKRVLVAKGQADEARSHLGSLGSSIQVIEVELLLEAALEAFPELSSRDFSSWESDEDARRALGTLYRQVLGGESLVLGWSSIAATAARLGERLAHDDEASERARFVNAVASRHESSDIAPMPWPSEEWLRRRPRPLRLQIVSHVVQSATDGLAPDLVEVAERALRMIADRGEEHPEDLMVLGAAGRAFAAAGDLDRAKALLLRAVGGWEALLEPRSASHALSELVRVLGVQRRREELEEVLATHVACFEADPRSDVQSRAFVALAVGRALVQVGEAARGLDRLADHAARWDFAPGHLVCSRLRWLARAQAAAGAHDAAAAARLRLSERVGEKLRVYHLLAQLDDSLERGADLGPALDALHASREAAESARLIGAAPLPDHEVARRLADEWRY